MIKRLRKDRMYDNVWIGQKASNYMTFTLIMFLCYFITKPTTLYMYVCIKTFLEFKSKYICHHTGAGNGLKDAQNYFQSNSFHTYHTEVYELWDNNFKIGFKSSENYILVHLNPPCVTGFHYKATKPIILKSPYHCWVLEMFSKNIYL